MAQFINSALSPVSYLTTELDSLAVDGVVLGAAINNSTARDMLVKVEINLATADLSSQTSPGVIIRLLESIDGGTTYEDNDDQAYGITLPVAATSATHRRMGEMSIPPGFYKMSVVNETGVIFNSTGNVLKYAQYTPETDV